MRNYLLVILFLGSLLMIAGCGSKNPQVELVTSMGSIQLELFPDVAPKHVANFMKLAKAGFYNGLTFHRVIDGFMIQGGDPNGDGTGGSPEIIPAEFNDSLHYDGTLAMARKNDPNSASSQFYICLGRQPHLDHQYTVFGKTIKGLDVVHAIGKTPTSGPSSYPQFKPLEPVYIEKVKIIRDYQLPK